MSELKYLSRADSRSFISIMQHSRHYLWFLVIPEDERRDQISAEECFQEWMIQAADAVI